MGEQAEELPVRAAVHATPDPTFVSGSRTVDLLAFLILACLVVSASYWRLRVYHQVTVWDVSLTRVAPNEARQVLPTPEHLRRSFSATYEPASAIASLEHNIRMSMESGQVAQYDDPDTRFEWLIRFSYNSTGLDHQRVLVFEADGSERR